MKLLKVLMLGLLVSVGFNVLAEDYVPSDEAPYDLNVGKIIVNLNSDQPASYSYISLNYPDSNTNVDVDSIIVNDGNCELYSKSNNPTTFYYTDCDIKSIAIDIGDGDEWIYDVPKF